MNASRTWLVVSLVAMTSVAAGADVDRAERAHRLAGKLMAPCCWSQTADQHKSGAAAEIKREISDLIEQGLDDEAILDHFVAKHGERILAVPRPSGFNLSVWILPVLVIAVGARVVRRHLLGIRKAAPPGARDMPHALSGSESRRLEKALAEE